MSRAPERFRVRDLSALSVQHLGREAEPLITVNSALEDPQSLVDFAATEVEFAPAWNEHGGYPGIRAPAPLDYVNLLVRRLDPAIRSTFGLSGVRLGRADCTFSLVTRTPDQLTPLQRIPHLDTTNALKFAILHYLSGPEFGGTGFYRHRATGFEAITPERFDDYERARDAELRDMAESPSYISGDTEHYERIGSVEARFDRVIVYRSRLLHSGQIPVGTPLSDDPRIGRLTANIFLTYRPQ